MTIARQLYKSRLLVAGITLLCLGIGNWMVGSHKVTHYQGIATQTFPVMMLKSSLLAKGLWKLPTDEGERANIARVKVDFYHVVVSGGRLLASIGTLCIIAAIIRLRTRYQE